MELRGERTLDLEDEVTELRRWLKLHKHYVIAFVIQIALAGFLIHQWDGFVFITSAQQFLQGLTPYQVASQSPPYTFSLGMQGWYAYPPLPLLMFSSSYAPCHFLFGDNPFLARILIKLPFILGNLLCAHLVYRFVAELVSEKKASIAEKMILYNPFLIFIGAIWGMFDIWIVNFLLLSLRSLRRNKFGIAGIFFGLSVLIKPYALIFAPLLLAHIWNRSGARDKPLVFASSAVAIFTLISLPFIISCPQGFMNQVIGMHIGRPGVGWGPFAAFGALATGSEMHILGFSLSPAAFSALSIALLGVSVLSIALYYRLKREQGESGLLAALFLTILAFTLFNKVVSPQYFVIPVALAVVLLQSYSSYPLIDIKSVARYYKFMVIPFVVAGFVGSLHFLKFIPPDIALPLFGMPINEVIQQIAAALPTSYLYQLIPLIILIALLAPATVMAMIMVARALKRVIPALSREASAYLVRLRFLLRRRLVMEKPVTIFFISLFAIVPSLAFVAGNEMGEQQTVSPPTTFSSEDKVVGAFYYLWHNPCYDPQVRYGDWLEAKLTPEEGYYDSTYEYMRLDIVQMKGAGIDFAILPVSGYYDIETYFVFAQEAEEEGFYFAPLLDLTGSNLTEDEVSEYIEAALRLENFPSFLRYEEKSVLFVRDDCSSLDWQVIREKAEAKYGELYWVGSCAPPLDEGTAQYFQTFDAIYIYSPADVWGLDDEASLQDWDQQVGLLCEYSEENDAPTLISVTPYFTDEETGIGIPLQIDGEYSYELLWDIALSHEPNIVLIAGWNDYHTDSSIEPTVEFGDLFLGITKEQCATFKATQ